MLKSALSVTVSVMVLAAPASVSAQGGGFDVKDVLSRMKAAYLALDSYADTGTVGEDVGGFENRGQFRTFFTRTPRNLLIDFRSNGSVYKSGFVVPSDHRMVFWMQNGELQKWDNTGLHETYPSDGGGQVNALKAGGYGSMEITVLIPSLLYTKANLATLIQAVEEPTAAGYEMFGTRRTFKVMGVERWRYPSGQITGVRPITVWIDADTYLIRKILEDTPKGSAVGRIARRTFMIEPQANPKLEATVFNFKVPTK
jgi:hypothetical protein